MDEEFTCCKCGETFDIDPDGGIEPSVITIETPVQGKGWVKATGRLCYDCEDDIRHQVSLEAGQRSWD